MRALTLWQPWAWAISDFTKRIENRIWAPWKATIGHRLAIHAGKRYDREAEAQIASHFKVKIPPRWSIPQGAIVAVCRVARG